MIYYAYLVEAGEGCDYTIGCGNTLKDFIADDTEKAVEKIKEYIIENYGHNSEHMLETVLLFTAHPIDINVEQVYEDEKEKRQKKSLKIEEDKDRADYERLKKRFEKRN